MAKRYDKIKRYLNQKPSGGMEFVMEAMDIFVEHLVAKQNTPKRTLAKVGTIVGGLVLAIVLFVLGNILAVSTGVALLMYVGFLLAVGVLYFGFRLFMSMNVEHEYIMTNGELDVDKIIARSKRKRVLTVDCKVFEVLARVDDPAHQAEQKSQSIKTRVDASSGVPSDRRWFALFPHKDLGRTLLTFEPNEKMMKQFARYIPSKICK